MDYTIETNWYTADIGSPRARARPIECSIAVARRPGDYKNITKTLLLPYYIYMSKIYNNYITYYIRSIKRLQIILHTFDV